MNYTQTKHWNPLGESSSLHSQWRFFFLEFCLHFKNAFSNFHRFFQSLSVEIDEKTDLTTEIPGGIMVHEQIKTWNCAFLNYRNNVGTSCKDIYIRTKLNKWFFFKKEPIMLFFCCCLAVLYICPLRHLKKINEGVLSTVARELFLVMDMVLVLWKFSAFA